MLSLSRLGQKYVIQDLFDFVQASSDLSFMMK